MVEGAEGLDVWIASWIREAELDVCRDVVGGREGLADAVSRRFWRPVAILSISRFRFW